MFLPTVDMLLYNNHSEDRSGPKPISKMQCLPCVVLHERSLLVGAKGESTHNLCQQVIIRLSDCADLSEKTTCQGRVSGRSGGKKSDGGKVSKM